MSIETRYPKRGYLTFFAVGYILISYGGLESPFPTGKMNTFWVGLPNLLW